MRVSDSHISPSCVAARRARRAGAGHLMLLSPAPSVRGHDHRPQHPTTSHHLRGHCRGEHGATLTSPPSALPRLLRRLTHCPRRLLFWVLFCQYSRVPFSYSSLRVIITRCPFDYSYRDIHYNITFVTKYFSDVEIFLSCRNISTAPEWLCPGARSARDWAAVCGPGDHWQCGAAPPLQPLPVPGTLPHVTTRDTAGILGYPDSYVPYYRLCECCG